MAAGSRVSRWAHAQGRDSDMVPPPDASPATSLSQRIPISKSIIADSAGSVFGSLILLFFSFEKKRELTSPQLSFATNRQSSSIVSRENLGQKQKLHRRYNFCDS